MGLNTSHGAFDGAYSAFNRFRGFLLNSIGGSWPPHEDISLDNGQWYWGKGYNKETHKGLYEFFCHSDCDGEITPELCEKIANDLEDILPFVEELERVKQASGHILSNGGYVVVTKRFIEGCRLAHERNESLEFR